MSKIKDLFAEVNNIDDLKVEGAMELAHMGYLIKKETVINKLEMLMQDTKSRTYKEVLQEAIDFIKEGEV